MATSELCNDYPWVAPDAPLVVSAPMMKITMAKQAVATSLAGGIGFLAGGFDLSGLSEDLAEAAEMTQASNLKLHDGLLPIGVGFQNWGADLHLALDAITQYPIAAVWFFAPNQLADLVFWTEEIRVATHGKTKVWIQVGTVAEALEVVKTCKPDVLVIQGADSGGHGLAQRAGIITLFPEIADALHNEGISIPLVATGGIMDGRGAAAALALGADAVALGTRFLGSREVVIAKGYQNEVIRVHDGGVSTVTSKVYDAVRGIRGWPIAYNGRGVANMTYLDALSGTEDAENAALYQEAMKIGDDGWGPQGRMTTYAGTGVGLLKEVKTAREIIEEIQADCIKSLVRCAGRFGARM